MKSFLARFIDFWKSYTGFFILPILLFISLRLVEYFVLIKDVELLSNPFRSFTYSVEFDLIFLALYYLLFLIVFFLIFLVSKKIYRTLFYVFLVVLTFVYIVLNQFFYTSDLLLDKTIFYFNWDEIQIIIGGESDGILGKFFWLYLVAIVVLTIGFWFIYPRLKSSSKFKIVAQLITIIAICLFVFRGAINPKSLDKYSNYETQLHTSKMTYFFESVVSAIFKKSLNTDNKIKQIKSFRSLMGRESSFDKLEYPLIHGTNDFIKNDWSKYISEVDKIKNIVIIFAEGLSSRLSGKDAKFGSMTPFLDSLSKKSLYWPNMLSITDRTHGVFSSALASLPHGLERGFLNYPDEKLDYISLPKMLKKEGYSMNFIYGGWSYFDNYHGFLKNNEFDSIVNEDYIKKYFNYDRVNTDNAFSWGIHDHVTVDAYFQFMEQHQPTSPYFNLYLTLSLHSPYDIPDKDKYISEAKSSLSHINPHFFEENEDVISTVYYSDDALRKFFTKYKTRSDFDETVFILLGDHSVTALDLYSELGIYHVPFFIYSPKIRNPKTFNEVISHWDVPATIVDLLQHINWDSNSNYTHWIGNGVSLSDEFYAKDPIFLGTFKGNIDGVVWKDKAYIHNRLYRLEKGLELSPLNDKEIESNYKMLLESYRWINRYTIEKNKITTPT
ncbi:MAG: LTA synthase family protein [Brumimicrobium sp.]